MKVAENSRAKAFDKVFLDTTCSSHQSVDELVLGEEEDDLAKAR